MKSIQKMIASILMAFFMCLPMSVVSYAEGEAKLTEENKIPAVICLVVALIAGIALVNGAYRLYMKITDADAMFYSRKKKLIATIIVTIIIWALLCRMFGVV